MSAVGEYVHLTAAGYNKYGIYRRDKRGRKENISSMSSRTVNQLFSEVEKKNVLSKSDATKIEKTLECILNPKTEADKSKSERIKQRVLQHMQEEFGEKFQVDNINWETGNIEGKYDPNLMLSELHRTLERSDLKQGKRLDPAKVRKTFEKMSRLIENGVESFKDEGLTVNKLKAEVERLEEWANELWGDLSQYSGDVFNDLGLPSLAEKGRFLQEQSFAKQVNELINRIGVAPAINLQKGTFFEFLISYLPYMADELAIDEITDNIKKIQTGSKQSKVSYSSTKVGPQEGWMFGIQKNNGIQTYNLKVARSQQKIDVNLEWNNLPLKISAKNIAIYDYTRVGVVSGTPLMFMIQDISTDFVNHYLNLNSMHIDINDKKNAQQYLTHLEGQKSSIGEPSKKEVNQTMKKLLAIKAVTGKVFGREQANVMILNDNKTGKIRVVTMRDIAERIRGMSPTQLSALTVNLSGSNIMDFKGFRNDPGQDAYGIERIYTNLYAQLHQIKVNVAIQHNVLQMLNSKT